MARRCKEDGEVTLGPHLEHFAGIIHAAIADYYERYGRDAHILERWTQAGIIRDFIVDRMKGYCESGSGLQPVRDGNASFFGFHSKYLVKIKRLGDGFRPRVGNTQAALQFDRQEVPQPQGELEYGEDLTTVYVGYLPTVNEPLRPPVFVVCKNEKRKVDWFIECAPPAPPPTIDLHPPGPGAPPAAEPPRVRVKKQRKSGTND